MKLFSGRKNPQEEFWQWFVRNESRLFDCEMENPIFNTLSLALSKIDPNLCFEFGPKHDGMRDFVISADGIHNSFPAVVALANAAPSLERWKVVAFRPRRSTLCIIEIGGETVDPEKVEFVLLDNGQKVGIYLFIPGFTENDTTLKQAGYLLLDEALGEYDVETRMGLIKMMSPDESITGERRCLKELPELFDELVNRLEGRPRVLN